MDDIFSAGSTFPPSLDEYPLLGMLVVASFWVMALICMRWIYETIGDSRERPAPVRSFVNYQRRVRLWVVLAAITVTVPRLAQLMLWQGLEQYQRNILSAVSWSAIIPAAAMFAYAWACDGVLVRAEQIYTARNGFYPVQTATRPEKTRSAIILLVIFVTAFATTFVRPQKNDRAAHYIVVERD